MLKHQAVKIYKLITHKKSLLSKIPRDLRKTILSFLDDCINVEPYKILEVFKENTDPDDDEYCNNLQLAINKVYYKLDKDSCYTTFLLATLPEEEEELVEYFKERFSDENNMFSDFAITEINPLEIFSKIPPEDMEIIMNNYKIFKSQCGSELRYLQVDITDIEDKNETDCDLILQNIETMFESGDYMLIHLDTIKTFLQCDDFLLITNKPEYQISKLIKEKIRETSKFNYDVKIKRYDMDNIRELIPYKRFVNTVKDKYINTKGSNINMMTIKNDNIPIYQIIIIPK